MPWYEKAQKNLNTLYNVGLHWDLWDRMIKIQVFSVIKQNSGKNIGYIEVQQSADKVHEAPYGG